MPLIPTVIRIANLAYKYGKTAGKFTSGETSFVGRFPPRYRGDVRTIIKGASTITYGGLISEGLTSLLNQDGTDHGNAQIPRVNRSPYSKRKARGGFGRRTNRYRKRCNCCKYSKRSRYAFRSR